MVAGALGYERRSILDVLGISFDFGPQAAAPWLAKFKLDNLRRKLRLVKVVAESLAHKRAHLQPGV